VKNYCNNRMLLGLMSSAMLHKKQYIIVKAIFVETSKEYLSVPSFRRNVTIL